LGVLLGIILTLAITAGISVVIAVSDNFDENVKYLEFLAKVY